MVLRTEKFLIPFFLRRIMGSLIDLTGQKFGKLEVIRLSEFRNGHAYWLCKCDCGSDKEIIRRGNSLRNGYNLSCGCIKKKEQEIKPQVKKQNTYDLSGEYGIGYTSKGEEFYFDLEDYDLIKDYCWYKDGNGYIKSRVKNKNISALHRMIMNSPNDKFIDHINHNIVDNRKKNLRIVTSSQNQCNKKIGRNNKSGHKGVNWSKRYNRWIAKIKINNTLIWLGSFSNIEDAIKIREEAEERYHGEYRYKNDD
jgi:hypothetical protein